MLLTRLQLRRKDLHKRFPYNWPKGVKIPEKRLPDVTGLQLTPEQRYTRLWCSPKIYFFKFKNPTGHPISDTTVIKGYPRSRIRIGTWNAQIDAIIVEFRFVSNFQYFSTRL